MSLFLALLPIYLFGNLHCLGMCGPLVLILGKNPFRYYYFLGRLTSFSLAGLFSGWMGYLFYVHLQQFHISAFLCLLIGASLLVFGSIVLLNIPLRIPAPLLIKNLSQKMASLSLKSTPFPIFLFGFCTILLPCGQTVVVYSALAIEGNPLFGLINGFIFASLTSPALLFAIRASHYLSRFKKYYSLIFGFSTIGIGILSLCRGAAELGFISHFTLNLINFDGVHFSLF